MTEATTSKRKVRTPAEIAAAELETATKAVERAEKRVETAKSEVTAAESALRQAKRRADYASQHPDLPENAAKDEADARAVYMKKHGVWYLPHEPTVTKADARKE